MSVNKVILIGRLTRDAEVRAAGQKQVASFSVATSEKFKDQSGEMRENSEFHDCELWGNEGVYQYLKKGQEVFVEGSIKTDKWTDQNGQEKSKKKIRVFSLQLTGSRPQTQQAAPAQPAYQPQPQYAQQPQYAPQPQYPPQQPAYQPQYPQAQPQAAPAPQYAPPQPQPQPYGVPFPQSAPMDDLPG